MPFVDNSKSHDRSQRSGTKQLKEKLTLPSEVEIRARTQYRLFPG